MKKMDLLARMRRVFGLGVASNVISIATGLAIPALLLNHLGSTDYARWIILFTIPLSLAALDFGISAAFSTEIYASHSREELSRAVGYFRSGIKITIALMLAVLIVSGVLISLVVAERDRPIILILSIYVLIGFPSEIISALFKSAELYHRYQIIQITSKLLEFLALALLAFTKSLPMMAAGLLLVKLVTTVFTLQQARKIFPTYFVGSWSGYQSVRHLVNPSLAYALNPAIMFLTLQVPVLMIGKICTTSELVAYTTIRTMARLPLQVSSQVSLAFFVEYTRLHEQGSHALVEKIYQKSKFYIASIFLLSVGFGLLCAEFVYNAWLNTSFQNFQIVFACLVFDGLFEAIVRNRICRSASKNQHMKDTIRYLAAAVALAGIFIVVLNIYHVMFMAVAWTSACAALLAISALVSKRF